MLFIVCLIITINQQSKAQVFWVDGVNSSDQVEFYYLQNDTANKGLFQAKETNLILSGYWGKLDKPLVITGNWLKHIIMRYKNHLYLFILKNESNIKSFLKDSENTDTVTKVTDLIEEGTIVITYYKPDPPGTVTEDPEIDTFLYIKEGSITLTFRKDRFEMNIKKLVLSNKIKEK